MLRGSIRAIPMCFRKSDLEVILYSLIMAVNVSPVLGQNLKEINHDSTSVNPQLSKSSNDSIKGNPTDGYLPEWYDTIGSYSGGLA